MSAPRVDVVCPTHQRRAQVLAAVDSVRRQTRPDWRLTVVADGCTDGTAQAVRELRDRRVRVLELPRGGPARARNAGLALAEADAVAYLDDDDRWEPAHLEVLLAALEGGTGLAATGCVWVDAAGRPLRRSGLLDTVWHPELQAVQPLIEPSRVGHARGLVEAVGGWSTATAGFEDWDLWFRLALAGTDAVVAGEPTVRLSVGGGTRREGLSAPHAVVLEPDVPARAVHTLRARCSGPSRQQVRARHVEELERWYADLLVSRRCRRPPGTTLADIRAALEADYLNGDHPALLERLVSAPVRGRLALFLPVWCMTAAHCREIGRVVASRHQGQRALLRHWAAPPRPPGPVHGDPPAVHGDPPAVHNPSARGNP